MNSLLKLASSSILLLFLISCLPVNAQDSPSVKTSSPDAPYVATLVGDFALVKKFTYLTPADSRLSPQEKAAQDLLSPASSKPAQIVAVEKGSVRKDTELFVDGSARDIWKFQIFRFSVYSSHPESVIIDAVNAQAGPTSPNQYQDASDFPELSWVTGSAFQGIQMQQGKKCYTYKLGDETAWIEVSTRLPVYLESKSLQVTYTFSTPPDEQLRLPKGYSEKLDAFKRALRGQM